MSRAAPSDSVRRPARGPTVRDGLRRWIAAAPLLAAGLGGGPLTAALAQGDAAMSVVVTGSVQAQRRIDAPFAIGVVDADALQAAGPMINLSEALSRVPGMLVANRHNHAQDLQISTRGFGARASFGVRGIRLYADGIPATMPDGQGQVAHFDLASAQRIEVLRGPFSVLYGNSSGGVIALFGAAAVERSVEFALDAGSDGLRQGRLRLAAPLGAGVDLQASLSDMTIDGFRSHSAAHRTLGHLRLGWQGPDDRVTVLLSNQRQRAQDPLGLSRAQWDADCCQTAPQAAQFDTRKTIDQSQAGISWRHGFGAGDGLRETRISVHRGSRGVTQWLAIAPAVQAPARHGGGVIDFDRIYAGVDARAVLQWGALGVVAGVNRETQRDQRRGFENFIGSGSAQTLGDTGALRRDEGNRASTRDAFVQAEWPTDAALTLTGGVRGGRIEMSARDRYLSNGDDSGAVAHAYTQPVIGLRWRPKPGWTVHASAARGFESPTLGELAYRSDGTVGLNIELKGQTSRQLELGSKWQWSDADLDLTLFAIDTDDEIGVQSNSGGRASFRNVGGTRRHGLELAARWAPTAAWRLQAAAGWLDASYRDGFVTCAVAPCTAADVRVPPGRRIAGTQPASAWAEAAWRPGVLPGELALEWRAIGRTVANDTGTAVAPGHALAHLRWRAQFALGADDALEVLARVDNLFDRVHIGSVIVNEAGARYFEPGSPRSLLLSLRWRHRW